MAMVLSLTSDWLTNVVMSKVRLAPELIPRLELTAAVVSTRLEHICHHLNLTLIDSL